MIRMLISSFKLAVRVIKNLILHPFRTLRNKFVYFFNVGRLVNKFPAAAKKLPKILKTKPEKREDYFDWGTIYVAKSLIIVILLLLILIPLLIYFIIYPLCVSWWGVRDFHVEDAALPDYSGRVRVYYDTAFEQLKFEGRLKNGKKIEEGEEYYENGRIAFAGSYADGTRAGDGIEYYEDGSVRYRGEFSDDRYHGEGEHTTEENMTYTGTFEKGTLVGKCTIEKDDVLWYAGEYADGGINGEGKMYYPGGTVHESGTFREGILEGAGLEYYEDGTLKYYGDYFAGLYHGNGTLYEADGSKLYAGAFEKGLYNGTGTLYAENGCVTTGSFMDGVLTGIGERTYPDGMRYEGSFRDELMSGAGILSDLIGSFTYKGAFVDDDIDYSALMGMDTADVNAAFSEQLKMEVVEDGFYLTHKGYGITIKCDFATENQPARVAEIASLPVTLGEGVIIRSEADIHAPRASSKKASSEAVPTWIIQEYGIDPYNVDCYETEYSQAIVYYWVDHTTGELLLKSAVSTVEGGYHGTGSGYGGLDRQEIIELFREVGLDIADFESLGF